jgi:hypothetical protein
VWSEAETSLSIAGPAPLPHTGSFQGGRPAARQEPRVPARTTQPAPLSQLHASAAPPAHFMDPTLDVGAWPSLAEANAGT